VGHSRPPQAGKYSVGANECRSGAVCLSWGYLSKHALQPSEEVKTAHAQDQTGDPRPEADCEPADPQLLSQGRSSRERLLPQGRCTRPGLLPSGQACWQAPQVDAGGRSCDHPRFQTPRESYESQT
jgi:hypothetical protein